MHRSLYGTKTRPNADVRLIRTFIIWYNGSFRMAVALLTKCRHRSRTRKRSWEKRVAKKGVAKIPISDCYENLKSPLINRPFRLISRPLQRTHFVCRQLVQQFHTLTASALQQGPVTQSGRTGWGCWHSDAGRCREGRWSSRRMVNSWQ